MLRALLPVQQINKIRSAENRGHNPDRDIGRRGHGSGKRVAENKKSRAGQHGTGHQLPVIRAEHKPHAVRDNQPDKADDAAYRNAGGCQNRTGNNNDAPRRFHGDAERLRRILPRGKQVQVISLLMTRNREQLDRIYLWTLGSFNAASWAKVRFLMFGSASGLRNSP